MNVLYVYLGDGLREDAKGLLFPFHLSFPSAFFPLFFLHVKDHTHPHANIDTQMWGFVFATSEGLTLTYKHLYTEHN